MRELKRNRKNESAYNSALNEVRYNVEHEFKPITLPGDWYIGLDDVKYDYDELSATLLVLNDKDEVVDEETITIPVDAMKDYTIVEIARLKDRMLEKINEVAENLKDSWNVGRGYYESKVKYNRKNENNSDVHHSDQFISSDELFYILASLAGLSSANSILENESQILERIAHKYKGETIQLDLPILANNFNGSLSDLLSSIFDYVEGIKVAAEKAIKYHTSIRDKYGL